MIHGFRYTLLPEWNPMNLKNRKAKDFFQYLSGRRNQHHSVYGQIVLTEEGRELRLLLQVQVRRRGHRGWDEEREQPRPHVRRSSSRRSQKRHFLGSLEWSFSIEWKDISLYMLPINDVTDVILNTLQCLMYFEVLHKIDYPLRAWPHLWTNPEPHVSTSDFDSVFTIKMPSFCFPFYNFFTAIKINMKN